MTRETFTDPTIHRFGELIALHSDEMPTVYMEAGTARLLATILELFADDVEKCSFKDSKLNKMTISRKLREPKKQEQKG